MDFYLPSIGGQVSTKDGAVQASPMLNTYSPRLFGAPPQLTHLNDMRLISSDGNNIGPVGDFYLNDILRDAHVANFVVGRALFTGGMSTLGEFLRTALNYAKALSKYNIYDNSNEVVTGSTSQDIINQISEEKIKTAIEENKTFSNKEIEETDSEGNVTTRTEIDFEGDTSNIEDSLSGLFGKGAGAAMAGLLTSMKINQPFYTFDSDWYSYINNVKMMINAAVVMLGLQKACVRIGDMYLPIGMDATVKKDTDVWSNYRYITPNKGLGTVTGIDNLLGDTTQYVSFMIEPTGISESYTNNSGQSQIYSSIINKGSAVGKEIAFITNSSVNGLDDAVLNLAGDAINVAESVISNLTLGTGKFTAAIAGSMARTFIGDHTIYPDIYSDSSTHSSIQIKTRFTARGGDPYSFLIDEFVPLSFAMCMALPQMTKNNAASYAFPPLVQLSIPGVFGTRLGLVENLTVTKNADGKSMSINGFPTSIDVTMTIKDLQHVLVTSPMNDPARFCNNNTMFDYIAQSCGCDKYKVNGAMRLVSKLALSASSVNNAFYNIGNAIMNDWTTTANRWFGTSRY